MTEVERLQQVVKGLHGVRAEHHASVPVHETFQGKTVWNGVVEVFRVSPHLEAAFAYAWSYKDDNGRQHDVAILGVPPVDSAKDAVRAYIVAQAEKKTT